MDYVCVMVDVKVTASITVEGSIKKIIWWIGFTKE